MSAFYTARWGKHGATNIGLVYQRYRPYRYSYCYNGDANGDGQTANDLIYVPATKEEAMGHLVADGFADNSGRKAGDTGYIESEAWENAWAVVCDAWERRHYLEAKSRAFSEALYGSSLDPDVIEALVSSITVFRSCTCFRISDGTFFGWEGCFDRAGSCAGNCTHVWNYAQAFPKEALRLRMETLLWHGNYSNVPASMSSSARVEEIFSTHPWSNASC